MAKPMPKTVDKIYDALCSFTDKDRLIKLYSLSLYCRRAYYGTSFRQSNEWEQAVSLTKEGKKVLSLAKKCDKQHSDALLKRVIFMSFSHRDLFVDHLASDLQLIQALVSQEISDSIIYIPNRIDRILYDKFNDKYLGQRLDFLETDKAEELIANEPQGVYQIGYYVSGPLGIIESADKRYVPPTSRLPLWHCQDVGCEALHEVELVAPHDSPKRLVRWLEGELEETQGPAFPWALPLGHEIDYTEGGREFYDLVAFFGACLLEKDATRIFQNALTHKLFSRGLNEAIDAHRLRAKQGRSPDGTAKQIPTLSKLQLLLAFDDRSLVQLLDEAIISSAVEFSSSEVRKLKVFPPKGNSRDTPTEASRLGLRSISGNSQSNLEFIILEAYQSAGYMEKLKWRLRGTGMADVKFAISKHVADRDPVDVIKELLLIEPELCGVLERKWPGFILSTDDLLNAQRVAWRLGFIIPSYDDRFTRLSQRLLAFQSITRAVGDVKNEVDRGALRSVGVNLFVSIEEFLEELVAFNVWYLSEDHYSRSEFMYCYAAAIRRVPYVLGVQGAFDWSPEGKNTLGGLLAYMDAALRWMQSLLQNEEREAKGPQELPYFADSKNKVFPYRHRQLWGDADPQELAAYVDRFGSLVKLLRKANLAFVRNGLDHKRGPGEFPTLDQMLECCQSLREALEFADMERLYPKIFWLMRREEDIYGGRKDEFRDKDGEVLVLRGPPMVWEAIRSKSRGPKVIGPGNLLGFPYSEIVFSVVEETAYQKHWSTYPRRASDEVPGSNSRQ